MDDSTKTIVSALSEEHICSITGLSQGQLRAWDKRGFFVPQYAYDDRSSANSRIYSFKDAVGLRTLSKLRGKPYNFSLNRLIKVARKLTDSGISHWADVTIYVVNDEISFRKLDDHIVEGAESGQFAMLEIIEVIEEVKQKIEDLKKRSNENFGKVERNRFVARNSWVVAGTRIPTATIKRYAEAGYSIQQIIEEYPLLTAKDIKAALQHEKGLAKSA